jgi:hypothetical protein
MTEEEIRAKYSKPITQHVRTSQEKQTNLFQEILVDILITLNDIKEQNKATINKGKKA